MVSLSRTSRLIWHLAIVAASSRAQSSIDADALLTLGAKRIAEAVDRQRRLTCEATISREFYRSDPLNAKGAAAGQVRPGSLWWRDKLRVDVALFDGRQLFSWPGTGSFRFGGLDEMTGGGTSGTGEFGSFAASFLADSDPASVRFRGTRE